MRINRFVIVIVSLLFFISLTLAASDVQVWSGQYSNLNQYNPGIYSFNFTIYDNLTGGSSCYTNTSTIQAGYFGEWKTEQFGVLAACSNQSKDYFLNIRIGGVDQGTRRRLTLIGNYTGYSLFNTYSPFWYDQKNAAINTILGYSYLNYSSYIPHTAGFITSHSPANHGDGTLTLQNETVNLYSTHDGSGVLKTYNLTGGRTGTELPAIPQGVSYIIGDYNNGDPIFNIITNREEIHQSDAVPAYTLVRDGNDVEILSWDSMGNAMAERINDRLVRTKRFERESGLGLSETSGRIINIDAGFVWAGAYRRNTSALDSATTDTKYYFQNRDTSWNNTEVTQYDNLYYNNGTALVDVGVGNYTINWIYLSLEEGNDIYIIPGISAHTTVDSANYVVPPTLPDEVQQMAILVGGIIVQRNNDTSASILSAFTETLSGGVSTGHNSLTGLLGGIAGEYYHLSSVQYNSVKSIISLFLSPGNGYFYNDSTKFYLNETKLNFTITDIASRYNETSYINSKINASFNQTLTDSLYLTKADQRYNDTTLINSVNSTLTSSKVSKSGDTMTGNLSFNNAGLNQPSFIQFNTTATALANAEGLLQWNPTDGTLDLGMEGGIITLQVGQEMFTKVRNAAGYQTINNGQVVYISGRSGVYPTVKLARSDNESTAKVIGIATEDITSPSFGYITTMGYVRGIKTDYSGTGYWGTTWVEGDKLYVSKTAAGNLTNIEPNEPHHSDVVGTVGVVSSNQGSILVLNEKHYTMEELTDVDGTPLTTSGQFPVWNQTAGYFDFDKNINNYLLLTDQRYNETSQIQALNITNKNITVQNILPQITNVFNLGSSILRWAFGYFTNLDVSGNAIINGTITAGNLTTSGMLNTTNGAYIGGNIVVQGNMSIKRPYGMFSSTETQPATSANTAYPMTFNWTEDSYQVIKSSDNANFTVQQSGDYLIELSIIAQSTNPGRRVYIWVQKTNSTGTMVNLARSTTAYDFKSSASNAVIAVPFIIDLTTTDKFRIMYAADNTGVTLQYITNTSFAPETPSIIMTITKVSETTPGVGP